MSMTVNNDWIADLKLSAFRLDTSFDFFSEVDHTSNIFLGICVQCSIIEQFADHGDDSS